MKEVESVTGHMGESVPVSPAEEAATRVAKGDEGALTEASSGPDIGADEPASNGRAPATSRLSTPAPDPWQALAQIGTQVMAALSAASRSDGPAHPWVERDAATGTHSLRIPLPPPHLARQIAQALSAFADNLQDP
jgi:hypothetical protein